MSEKLTNVEIEALGRLASKWKEDSLETKDQRAICRCLPCLLVERAEMEETIKQQKEWIVTLNADRETLLLLLEKECGAEWLPKAVAEIMARKATEPAAVSGKIVLPPEGALCERSMKRSDEIKQEAAVAEGSDDASP